MSPSLLLVLCASALHIAMAAVDVSTIQKSLDSKKYSIQVLKKTLEDNYVALQQKKPIGGNTATNNTLTAHSWFNSSTEWPLFGTTGTHGLALDACGSALPSGWGPSCDRTLGGDTAGCECKGRKRVRSVSVKSLDKSLTSEAGYVVNRRNAGNHAAFAAGASMAAAYKSADPDFENKWMYYGAADGSFSIYPGILWPRDKEDTTKCGAKYDPRLRPWYLSASNGPKNVIFILDVSGSMSQNGRLESMKKAAIEMIDSLSFADYIGVVTFSSKAQTLYNLKFLAPAQSRFRDKLKSLVSELKAEGATNYEAALMQAFKVADTSYQANYDSGYQTAYVFLTDGEQTEGSPEYVSLVSTRTAKNVKRAETFIVIGFGSGLQDDAKIKLKSMACTGKGIYQQVADRTSNGDGDVARADFELVQALSLFSQYFTTKNTLKKRDSVTYSEIYELSWDGVTSGMEITTASVPVYDKSDRTRWKFLGVVAIDVTVCDIEQQIVDKNPDIQNPPSLPEITKFPNCACANSYSYNSKTYEGGICTTDSWPVAWCMTDKCGITDESMSTGSWADCKPFGARAVLEDLLLKSGEEGWSSDMDATELEALRPPANRCGSDGVSTTAVSTTADFNFVTKLPGFGDTGFADISDADWNGNAGGSYSETEWSQDESKCDQCKNTEMKPQCALPAACNAGIRTPTRGDTLTGTSAQHSVQWEYMLLLLSIPLLAVLM